MQTEQALEPNTLLASNGNSHDPRKLKTLQELTQIYEYLKDRPKSLSASDFDIPNINVLLSELNKSKLLAHAGKDGQKNKYKWDTIVPNYHMASKVVDSLRADERQRNITALEKKKNAPEGTAISSRPVKILQLMIKIENCCGKNSSTSRPDGYSILNRSELEEQFSTLSNRVIPILVETNMLLKIRENKADFYYKWSAEKPTMEMAHKLDILLSEKLVKANEINTPENIVSPVAEEKIIQELVPVNERKPSFTFNLLWGFLSITRWK